MAAKFTIPGTTYIGDGALAAAGSDICALGTKALIVTGQSMIKQGFMKVLTDILEQNGVGYVIDSKISGDQHKAGNPTVKQCIFKHCKRHISAVYRLQHASKGVHIYNSKHA